MGIRDLSGNELHVESVYVGCLATGDTGTEITSGDAAIITDITPGTAVESKAVVLGPDKEIATITTATITGLTTTTIAGTPTFSEGATFDVNPALGPGVTFDVDSAAVGLTAHAVTATKFAGTVTSEALTTAGGASQAFVITLVGVAAGDLAFVQAAGGTNTRKDYTLEAVTTTDTITVTLYCNEPTNAINGTVKFNYWVLKA